MTVISLYALRRLVKNAAFGELCSGVLCFSPIANQEELVHYSPLIREGDGWRWGGGCPVLTVCLVFRQLVVEEEAPRWSGPSKTCTDQTKAESSSGPGLFPGSPQRVNLKAGSVLSSPAAEGRHLPGRVKSALWWHRPLCRWSERTLFSCWGFTFWPLLFCGLSNWDFYILLTKGEGKKTIQTKGHHILFLSLKKIDLKHTICSILMDQFLLGKQLYIEMCVSYWQLCRIKIMANPFTQQTF